MYGLVNRALEELIRSHHGAPAWEATKARAGVDIASFARMQAYPDEITYALVGAASELLGEPVEQLLFDFGEYWMLYTGQEGYGALLDAAGASVAEVLTNLNDLHVRVGSMYPELRPPTFHCTDMTEDGLVLHYYSPRDGLAPMVMGLLHGLGKHYGQALEIRQLADKRHGEDHDSFVIRWL